MEERTKSAYMWLLGIVLLVVFYNGYQIQGLKAATDSIIINPGIASAAPSASQPESVSGVSGVIPKGIPDIYGQELGISFDGVSPDNPQLADATIARLSGFDTGISLDAAQKQRYVNILYKMENGISCEFCCGARSVIFENGEPACGCAHSYAMRGLTKYLITKHGDEYSDAQILEEAGKWKVLFFPGIHEQKAAILQEKGIEMNYINLASNKYRGIEQGKASGQMVGGC